MKRTIEQQKEYLERKHFEMQRYVNEDWKMARKRIEGKRVAKGKKVVV